MAAVQSYIGLASLVVHTHSASQGQDLPGETQDLESMFPDLAQGHVASWWCLGSSGSAPSPEKPPPIQSITGFENKACF